MMATFKEQTLRELDDLKMAVAALASMVGKEGSHERENAKNIVTGLRARIDDLHSKFEKLISEPGRAVPPSGPWVAQSAQGESIMEVVRRQIEVSRQDADRHPYINTCMKAAE